MLRAGIAFGGVCLSVCLCVCLSAENLEDLLIQQYVVGGLGLLNETAALQSTSALDGDEGIGSLSPDLLVFDGSPWFRTSAGLTATLQGAETTSSTSRRSWMDTDISASSGTVSRPIYLFIHFVIYIFVCLLILKIVHEVHVRDRKYWQ